jgi:hypothetical protein
LHLNSDHCITAVATVRPALPTPRLNGGHNTPRQRHTGTHAGTRAHRHAHRHTRTHARALACTPASPYLLLADVVRQEVPRHGLRRRAGLSECVVCVLHARAPPAPQCHPHQCGYYRFPELPVVRQLRLFWVSDVVMHECPRLDRLGRALLPPSCRWRAVDLLLWHSRCRCGCSSSCACCCVRGKCLLHGLCDHRSRLRCGHRDHRLDAAGTCSTDTLPARIHARKHAVLAAAKQWSHSPSTVTLVPTPSETAGARMRPEHSTVAT